jgi:hypothetical protein
MKDPRSSGSYQGPPLTQPELGQPITAAADHAYRKRSSSERQAEIWNEILENDPILGPESGFRVRVAPIVSAHDDGPRWDLIWISTQA